MTIFVRFLDGRPIEEGEMSMEPEFLVEIMEMNEEIFDAETRCDIFWVLLNKTYPIGIKTIINWKKLQKPDLT